MELYKIKKSVPRSEYQKIINFLKLNWNANHALVRSKALMDFQHYNKDSDSYNFIVAENQITGEYDALTGYIPTSQYDKSLEQNGDYWGAIWKRSDHVDNDEGKGIGLDVWEAQFTLPNFKSHGGISLSGDAVRWYKAIRWHLYYMHQYYIINNECTDYIISRNVTRDNLINPSNNKTDGWTLEWVNLNDIKEDAVEPTYRPYKSIEFLRNRYQLHPIYHYQFLGLFNNEKIKAILVVRVNEVLGKKVLRIVDCLGKLGGYIYPSMQDILHEGDFEYVDFLNYGIDKEIFFEMGFLENDFQEDGIILPNYYEPFEQRNVKMTVIWKAKFPYVAFKGDADQDRPNII